jgi:hypothetical protein
LEEDPICYGIEWIQDFRTNETHCFIELKEEKTDSFASPRPGGASVRTPGMGSIPEEVSVDNRSYSNEVPSPFNNLRNDSPSVRSVGSRGTQRDMSVCSDQYSRNTHGLNEYLQDCEDDLLRDINNRGRDTSSFSVTSDYTDASKRKPPPKKQRTPQSATIPTNWAPAFASLHSPKVTPVDNRKKPPPSPHSTQTTNTNTNTTNINNTVFRVSPIVTTVNSFSTAASHPSPASVAPSLASTRGKRKNAGQNPRFAGNDGGTVNEQ